MRSRSSSSYLVDGPEHQLSYGKELLAGLSKQLSPGTASSGSCSARGYTMALTRCYLKRQPVWQREQEEIVDMTLEGRVATSSEVEESMILYYKQYLHYIFNLYNITFRSQSAVSAQPNQRFFSLPNIPNPASFSCGSWRGGSTCFSSVCGS